jgi:hypothetical protein
MGGYALGGREAVAAAGINNFHLVAASGQLGGQFADDALASANVKILG